MRIFRFFALFGIFFWITLSTALASPGKIIVLGFDGTNPDLVEKWIQEGNLPNLETLRSQGTFVRLATTNPAESPVAWASFATGKNPGQHRIFGFLKRAENEYRPRLALARIEKRGLLGGVWGKAAIAAIAGIVGGAFLYFLCFAARKLRQIFSKTWHPASPHGRMACCFSLSCGIIIAGLSLYLLCSWLPYELPYPVSCKEGVSLWTLTGQAGIKTVVLGAPVAFPAEKVPNGRLICGLGVPDISGTHGLWFRYSTRFPVVQSTETGGWEIPLTKTDNGWKGSIFGPPNILMQEEESRLKEMLPHVSPGRLREIQNRLVDIRRHKVLCSEIQVKPFPSKDKWEITIGKNSQECEKGKWSDWFSVSFRISPILHLTGMSRIYVFSNETPEICMTPIQFHPYHVPRNIAISYPADFAAKMADKSGLFSTLGWATATNPFRDALLTEEAFWQDMEYHMASTEKMFFSEFAEKDWRLLISIFYIPDRAGHMYYRFLDPEHPRCKEDSEKFPLFQTKFQEVYKWIDSVVGKVLAQMGKEDTLLVCSDHGFAPFRYEVNLNRWLYQENYLALKDVASLEKSSRLVELFDPENSLLSQVDWKRTQAYALGLGNIFINLQGREPEGIVSPEDHSKLCEEIRAKLLNLRHNNKAVVDQANLCEEIYTGPYQKEGGDIVVGFSRGYRIAWQSTLGNLSAEVVTPNLSKWSGDHCSVSPRLIPGILFCNRKMAISQASLLDLAPTILALLGVPVPVDMEGKNLTR